MKCVLHNHDWGALHEHNPNDALNYFIRYLTDLCEQYIPQSEIVVRKQTHPWLNDDCRKAISIKNACEDTAAFTTECDKCAQVLQDAYKSDVLDLKAKISELPRGDKRCWALNRQLSQRTGRVSAIPPFRVDSEWLLDALTKANAFAQTWQSKNVLPPMSEDQFLPAPDHFMKTFVAIRTRTVLYELLKLDINKATGPDRIGPCILRELASEIAIPLAIICRRLLREGIWPDVWKIHYLVAIYKRGAVHSPPNHCGVHLTSMMSKVVERVIGSPLTDYSQQYGYGANQLAVRKKCSSRNLVLFCINSCVLAICTGNKMAVLLGDISGTFDRVCKELLMVKLVSLGMPDMYSDFLNSYLDTRVGYVTVEGAFSDAFDLTDQVFTGTVLGPALGNTLFGEAAVEAASGGGTPRKFVDDLNIFQKSLWGFSMMIFSTRWPRPGLMCTSGANETVASLILTRNMLLLSILWTGRGLISKC